MAGYVSRLTAQLPTPVQAALLNGRYLAFSLIRSGRQFQHVLERLERTQWLPQEELGALQQRLLFDLLHEAAKAPHYAASLRRLPLDEPGAAVAALRRVPVMAKQDVVAHGPRMLHPAVPRWRRRAAHSSGTTGTPLVVYRDRRSVVHEHAIIWRQWRWAGYQHGERRATLRGDMVVPAAQQAAPFWRYNAVDRQLFMSSYHLSPTTGPAYVAELASFKPAAIQAYPSSAYLLARFVLDAGVRSIRPKAVFTSSEVLFPHQRAVIEQAFACPVYDFYGTTERVVAIGTCEAGTYHVFPEYGFTEFLPDERRSDVYRLVGTPFHNAVMPLLRYDAGDRVRLGSGSCSCGRHFPIVEAIEGRADDYVLTPEGRLLGRLDHIFKDAANVVEAQIEQFSPREIVVRLVPAERYSAADGEHIRANLVARTGVGVDVLIEVVPAIARTKSGKFRAVISHCASAWQLPLANGEAGAALPVGTAEASRGRAQETEGSVASNE